tara:strand:+ start:264 stop:656 length:393 start_codon:yes stop_codon:yes gene_type:complete
MAPKKTDMLETDFKKHVDALRKMPPSKFLTMHVGLDEKAGRLHRGVIKSNEKHSNTAFIKAIKWLEKEMIDKYNTETVEDKTEVEDLPSLVPLDKDPRVLAGTHQVVTHTVDWGGKGRTIKVPEVVPIDP